MKTIPKSWMGLALAGLLLWPQSALAIDEKKSIVLKSIDVVGTKEDIKDIAASAHVIETQDIRKQSYDNIDRLLRKIPGVYTREEDGNGLFPNISLRGVDPGRSSKVTIMEDGVMMAPAPYSAPAAYFSPTAGRMSSIEVLKGSSQVRYGPHTTGGVINYKATAIPEMQSAYSKTLFGSFGELRNHTHFGNTIDTDSGRFGYVIENYYRENNGFRQIQPTGDFRNVEDTGIENLEPMIKVMFEPNSTKYQRFEFKFGYTERDANETYLGQTEADFRANPFRRLAATRFDLFESEQYRTHIRHFIELTPETSLVTTAYGTVFWRNWQKLGNCKDGGGVTVPSNLSRCLKDPNGDALLKGTGPGILRLRNNNRNYYTYGVESQLTHQKNIGATEHTFHAGVRYHYDQIRRFQWEEEFTQDANGFITNKNITPMGSAGNRRQKTTALAFNVDDQIKWGNWTFKPGARYEQLWQSFVDFNSADERRRRNYGVWAAGGSFDYRFNEATNAFFGIHRGFSVASPNGATKKGEDQIDEETSLGYELGTRYNRPDLGFRTELIGFWTDLDDLVVDDIAGASGALVGETRNLGEVRTRGVEFMVEYDPSVRGQWSVRNPWYFTLTYTDATFRSSLPSADVESIFSGATKGDKVPNVPELQFAVGTALIWNNWQLNIDGQYVDSTFTTGNNATNEQDFNGVGDVRFGETDSVFLLDVSLAHQLNEHVRLFTNFRNATDATYLAGRLPHGPRAGPPFQAFGGIEITY